MSSVAGVSSAIDPCHHCTIDCWATCELRSARVPYGYRGVYMYPNGNGWLAKRQVDGKRVIFGTQDSPQALLLPSCSTFPAQSPPRPRRAGRRERPQ